MAVVAVVAGAVDVKLSPFVVVSPSSLLTLIGSFIFGCTISTSSDATTSVVPLLLLAVVVELSNVASVVGVESLLLPSLTGDWLSQEVRSAWRTCICGYVDWVNAPPHARDVWSLIYTAILNSRYESKQQQVTTAITITRSDGYITFFYKHRIFTIGVRSKP